MLRQDKGKKNFKKQKKIPVFNRIYLEKTGIFRNFIEWGVLL
jgi:hypothetical protein